MAKSSKAADRKAVVEQLRREQQRKERRQGLLILGVALLVAAVIIFFAVRAVMAQQEKDSRGLASIGASAAQAGCKPVKTVAAKGSADHQPEGQPILYPETPPAFGPHWGNYVLPNDNRKLWTVEDRPPVERLVHSLEHGHTILWYDDTIDEDSTAFEDLRSIVKKFPSRTAASDKFMAAPWTPEDGGKFPEGTHVALTHWTGPDEQQGVWQYCSKVSGEVVEKFMSDYPATNAPEPGAA